jgi:hypothetical protein
VIGENVALVRATICKGTDDDLKIQLRRYPNAVHDRWNTAM